MEWTNYIIEYQGIIQWITVGILGWIWWSARKMFVQHEKCQKCRDAITTRVDALETRQLSFDNDLKTLPTVKDMHAVALGIEEMRGDLKALTKSVGTIEKHMDLINEATLEAALERKRQ